jgi:hypothetical protein
MLPTPFSLRRGKKPKTQRFRSREVCDVQKGGERGDSDKDVQETVVEDPYASEALMAVISGCD